MDAAGIGRIAAGKVGAPFEVIVTSERAGFYKPDPRPEMAPPPMHEARSLHDLVDYAIRGQGQNS